jgi:hypothetical protein
MKHVALLSSAGEKDNLDAGSGSNGSRFRMRRLGVAVLVVLSLVAPACTPEEIEMSLEQIAVSFEQGGVERGLAEAVLVVDYAIPVIGMRLGSALGP